MTLYPAFQRGKAMFVLKMKSTLKQLSIAKSLNNLELQILYLKNPKNYFPASSTSRTLTQSGMRMILRTYSKYMEKSSQLILRMKRLRIKFKIIKNFSKVIYQ
jgi:hypothetical protein